MTRGFSERAGDGIPRAILTARAEDRGRGDEGGSDELRGEDQLRILGRRSSEGDPSTRSARSG